MKPLPLLRPSQVIKTGTSPSAVGGVVRSPKTSGSRKIHGV
jgi:hypothetical protein